MLSLAALQCGPGSVGSIGAVLGRDTHTGAVHVRDAPEGLGAAEAGLLPGDRLKMVNGVLVDDLDRSRIQALLRGPVGSTVTLTVIRGQEVLHLEVSRQALGTAPTVAPAEERIE
ncbi:MAG: PDZ domain-containing protein [Deltaproteobacteria bacterium]|nr:PDZ domain-containing protein [Deltaproteobacteria bacterium]